MVLLFDNHIGRKRNVDGGVLAGLSDSLSRRDIWRSRFQVQIVSFVFSRDRNGFGTRQEKPDAGKAFWLIGICRVSDECFVTSRHQNLSLQLESLILAQNERWRQA